MRNNLFGVPKSINKKNWEFWQNEIFGFKWICKAKRKEFISSINDKSNASNWMISFNLKLKF